jgi:hypothetical protein
VYYTLFGFLRNLGRSQLSSVVSVTVTNRIVIASDPPPIVQAWHNKCYAVLLGRERCLLCYHWIGWAYGAISGLPECRSCFLGVVLFTTPSPSRF